MCGENCSTGTVNPSAWGSSPRVRGKLPIAGKQGLECGLIPACAGKTLCDVILPCRSRAHPRVCGENSIPMECRFTVQGSSPRVRGKLVREARRRVAAGLIPACAGKTHSPSTPMCSTTAHPRVCGENPMAAARPILAPGSSPRVRGKHRSTKETSGGVRLIPACAGKTSRASASLVLSRAHPRVCGENTRIKGQRLGLSGSSPRVRGKHSRD